MTDISTWLRRVLPNFFDPEHTAQMLEIPIFPLHVVLFPGGVLPLRIFEQRYMDMVKACLRDDLPFGVCLIREGEEVGAPATPQEIGCLVRVTDWDMPQLGVLNITVAGVQRFCIREWKAGDNGLITARVIPVSVEPPQFPPDVLQPCATVLQRIVAQIGAEKIQPPLEYDNAVWVGYRLAEVLPLKLGAKQSMLEMNDPIARLQILHKFLVQQGLVS